ncbi:unnamed protein product [Diabrotica balteata]|uniref:Uncharacterized protein n=1 Tax=Diabrotica balteata TaxID=107213 RepID=A0A9N9SSH4_DIABA|nr:unnamed protein product [Diabrotica balteata]
MTDTCKGLEPFSFQGNNISHEWKFWKQKFQLFLTAFGKSEKPDHIKIGILVNQLGDEGLKIFNTFEYENVGDDQKYNVVLCKFDTYCSPLKNLFFEHFKFFKRDKLQNESIDQFVTALKQLASTCEFTKKDTLILDRIVLGTHDLQIQEKLLQCSDLKLAQAIDICRAMENSAVTQREISKESESISSFVKKRKEDNRPVSTGQSRYGSNSDSDDESMEKESSRPDEKVQGSKITPLRNKIKSPRKLKELKAVAKSSLQRNAFMAHSEHILLGMLFDSLKHIRAFAGKRIEKARQTETRAHRVFKPPQVNFETEDYINLIDWQSTRVTKPPLMADFSKEEIEMIVNSGSSDRKEFKIPLHTQAVERVVKEVTAASKHVFGVQEREGFIRSGLLDRKYLPKFETKRQYTFATAVLQK